MYSWFLIEELQGLWKGEAKTFDAQHLENKEASLYTLHCFGAYIIFQHCAPFQAKQQEVIMHGFIVTKINCQFCYEIK